MNSRDTLGVESIGAAARLQSRRWKDERREAGQAACAAWSNITRRDFIGATLISTGAALLNMPCPAAAQDSGGEGSAWRAMT